MEMKPRFWTLAALLLLLVTPGLSCLVRPLSAAENECCRQMGSQCGSKEMQSPQSCCKLPRQQTAQPYVSSANHLQIVPAAATAAFLLVQGIPSTLRFDLALRFAQFYSPPLSPPETSSILRI